VAARAGATAALVSVLAFTGSGRVVASGILPGANPTANLDPSPDFLVSGPCAWTAGAWHCENPCVTGLLAFPSYTSEPSCLGYVARALGRAWSRERIGPLVLPSNFAALTAPEQLFVLANLERTARGLPPYLGLNAALTREAQLAADADADPGLAPGFAVGVNRFGAVASGAAWASTYTTLGADYLWMYADGWGGSTATTSNVACTSPRAAGCWAHRDELLGADLAYGAGAGLWCRDCEMGAGFADVGSTSSFTDLVERPAARPPAMTFTWVTDVVPYLPPTGAVAAREARRARVAARRARVLQTWSPWHARARAASPCLARRTERQFAPLGCRHRTFTRAGTSPVAHKEER
jgi:hypothetical protein